MTQFSNSKINEALTQLSMMGNLEQNPQSFDFIKKERISRLQEILNKNDKLRFQNQSIVKYKRSLNPIAFKPKYEINFLEMKNIITDDNHLKTMELSKYQKQNKIIKEQNQLKSQRQINFLFSKASIQKILKNEYKGKSACINQDQFKGPNKSRNNSLKIKLTVFNFQTKQDKQQHNNSDQKRNNIHLLKKSIGRLQSLEKLDFINNKSESKEKQQIRAVRKKRRNLSSLNLAKIEHLPQIVFPKNKKCERRKFPSSSLAQIDRKLIVNQIQSLEEKRNVQIKQRQAKQRILKARIKYFEQNNMSIISTLKH